MTGPESKPDPDVLLVAFNRWSEQIDDPGIPLRTRQCILLELDNIGAALDALGHDWVLDAVDMLREQLNLDQMENSRFDPERCLRNPALYRFDEWPVTPDGELVEFEDL